MIAVLVSVAADCFFASVEMGRWAFGVLILLWVLFPFANSSGGRQTILLHNRFHKVL